MIFDKRMSYDLNPLSLPRLSPYENYSSIDVLVRKINEDTGVIRFSNLLDFAKSQDIDLITAGNILCESYGLLNYVAIINEEKFYKNNTYRQTVLESYRDVPMQMEYADYDVLYYNILEQSIFDDISSNTHQTDILLETGVMNDFNDMNYSYNNFEKSGAETLSGLKKDMQHAFFVSPTKWFFNKVDENLTQQDMDDFAAGVSKRTQNFGSRIASEVIRGGARGTKRAVTPYIKGAALAAVVGGGLYTLNRQVNNLTDNERLKETVAKNNPNILRRLTNSLNKCLTSLLVRKRSAPPQKQGIISRLINKIQNAIAYLARKVGFHNHEVHN